MALAYVTLKIWKKGTEQKGLHVSKARWQNCGNHEYACQTSNNGEYTITGPSYYPESHHNICTESTLLTQLLNDAEILRQVHFYSLITSSGRLPKGPSGNFLRLQKSSTPLITFPLFPSLRVRLGWSSAGSPLLFQQLQ